MTSGERPRSGKRPIGPILPPRPLVRSHVIIDQIDQMCHKSLTSCFFKQSFLTRHGVKREDLEFRSEQIQFNF